jgi:uncharacterized damage-inducible protein DinB
MYRTLADFLGHWAYESESTQKLLDTLTDDSLAQAVVPGGRTLGRLAWHIAQTIPEMMNKTGVHVTGIGERDPVPATAAAIADAYRAASRSLVEQVTAQWTDASLAQEDDMYGERWTRAMTLSALVSHQIHHRGQMTVLMRQAGLVVPGVYGPAEQEWAAMGMQPPPV